MTKKRNTDLETICPCCQRRRVEKWDICETCGWQNDPLQTDFPDRPSGANKISLTEARARYAATKSTK
jgi:hypothetical protein